MSTIKFLDNRDRADIDVAIANAKSNWLQNDEAAPDYIRGRTHYVKGEGQEIILEPTFCETDGRLSTAHRIPSPVKINMKETYIVNYEGTDYECKPIFNPTLQSIYLGNGNVYEEVVVNSKGELTNKGNLDAPFGIDVYPSFSVANGVYGSVYHEMNSGVTISIRKAETTELVEKLPEKFYDVRAERLIGQEGQLAKDWIIPLENVSLLDDSCYGIHTPLLKNFEIDKDYFVTDGVDTYKGTVVLEYWDMGNGAIKVAVLEAGPYWIMAPLTKQDAEAGVSAFLGLPALVEHSEDINMPKEIGVYQIDSSGASLVSNSQGVIEWSKQLASDEIVEEEFEYLSVDDLLYEDGTYGFVTPIVQELIPGEIYTVICNGVEYKTEAAFSINEQLCGYYLGALSGTELPFLMILLVKALSPVLGLGGLVMWRGEGTLESIVIRGPRKVRKIKTIAPEYLGELKSPNSVVFAESVLMDVMDDNGDGLSELYASPVPLEQELIVGQTYKVKYNNTSYTLTATELYEDGAVLGVGLIIDETEDLMILVPSSEIAESFRELCDGWKPTILFAALNGLESAPTISITLSDTFNIPKQLTVYPDGSTKWEELIGYKYVKSGFLEIFPEEILSYGDDDDGDGVNDLFASMTPLLAMPEEGKEYEVTINGEVYNTTARPFVPEDDGVQIGFVLGNPMMEGLEDNGEPYALLILLPECQALFGGATLMLSYIADTVTLAISGEAAIKEIKQIDPDLIPGAHKRIVIAIDADGNVTSDTPFLTAWNMSDAELAAAITVKSDKKFLGADAVYSESVHIRRVAINDAMGLFQIAFEEYVMFGDTVNMKNITRYIYWGNIYGAETISLDSHTTSGLPVMDNSYINSKGRSYLSYHSGGWYPVNIDTIASDLGLPIPTAADAGKILRVNAQGKYELVSP